MKKVINHKSHFCLTVSNLKKSKEWYDKVLGHLGFVEAFDDESTKYYISEDNTFLIGLYEAKKNKKRSDRQDVGFHHLGIATPKKEIVDEMYKSLQQNKFEIESPPHHVPDYGDELYYALFFYDPDGMRLEVFYEIN